MGEGSAPLATAQQAQNTGCGIPHPSRPRSSHSPLPKPALAGVEWKIGNKPRSQLWILIFKTITLPKGQPTYGDLEVDGFVPNLPVDHGGLQEGSEEEEFLHLPAAVLQEKEIPGLRVGARGGDRSMPRDATSKGTRRVLSPISWLVAESV